MKLFYVDQYGKVQEFNGTDEEKASLACRHNLFFREYDAIYAAEGFKPKISPSLFNHPEYLEKWVLTHTMSPAKACDLFITNAFTLESFRRMGKDGLLFDTEEEAKAMSEKLKSVLRGEAAHRASTPRQSQAPQDGQRQPCSEERQSQGESSFGHTKHNNGCTRHEQGHPCSQGRVQVTVIEMFL